MKQIAIVLVTMFLISCGTTERNSENSGDKKKEKRIILVRKDAEKKVEVFIDQQLLTAYIYPESIKKPVLFPLLTASGKSLTRGFPLDPQPWERVDHPHHVGMWLNHGDTEGLDFWNNSDSIPENRRPHYGTIFHQSIEEIKNGDDFGYLEVSAEWERPDGRVLLEENTKYYLRGGENVRTIDRISTLTAPDLNVLFKDSKEGMMAIRVNRAMELPGENTIEVLDENMNITEVKVNDGNRSRGHYLNSEGIEGPGVWGQRARWVRLGTDIDGEKAGIIIMDHPDNPNHPTHWHARGYGLFSANPLGVRDFTQEKDELDYSLPAGGSTTFRYRVIVHSGTHLTEAEINDFADDFAANY